MRTDKLIRGGLLLATSVLAAAALGVAGLPAQAAAPVAGVAVQAADRAADKAAALEAAKKLTAARIDGRLAVLRTGGVVVRNAARLSDAHQAALQKIIDADLAGLTELRKKVL